MCRDQFKGRFAAPGDVQLKHKQYKNHNMPRHRRVSSVNRSIADSSNKMYDANTHFNAFYIRHPILKKIISTASVVCTTLDALVTDYFTACMFPRVIIDDASSSLESLTISAITKNC